MIELVQTSFDDVFKNEFGALDFSRSQNGSGMSSRNEARHLFLGVYLCFLLFGYFFRGRNLSKFCSSTPEKQEKRSSNWKNLEN